MASLALSTTTRARRNALCKTAIVALESLAVLLVGVAAGLRAASYEDPIRADLRFVAVGSLAAVAVWTLIAWAKRTFVTRTD